MLNFDVRKSSRKCFVDEKEFSPGEIFYSALIELDTGETERRDFCKEHWETPDETCVGWWKAQVPESETGKVYWAPRKVLLSFFQHSLQQPQTHDVAYLTGLMLLQKKILVMEEELENGNIIRLRNRLDQTTFDVPVFDLDHERLTMIQGILAEQLFMDEPVPEPEKDEIHE